MNESYELICSLLDRSIAFQRPFVTLTGSVTGALMLSQAWYWQRINRSEDGFWWKTYEDWHNETGMSRHELDGARKACSAFLKVEKRGIPAKCYYRLDPEALVAALQTSLPKTGKLDCRKPANCDAENRQTTVQKSTSEITSKNNGAFRENDSAIELLKAFREKFPHYAPPADPKMTKRELMAANALLASATAAEILDLAAAALNDRFPGNRVRASNLRKMLENFTELRAQFGRVSRIAIVPVLPQGDKTDAEVWADWEEYCNFCRVEGIDVDETMKPSIPRPPENAPGAFGGRSTPTHPPSPGVARRQ